MGCRFTVASLIVDQDSELLGRDVAFPAS